MHSRAPRCSAIVRRRAPGNRVSPFENSLQFAPERKILNIPVALVRRDTSVSTSRLLYAPGALNVRSEVR